jgi:hypothetical protein
MSEVDILAEWKTQRFVIADGIFTDQPGTLIILCDIAYWTEHYADLIQWCQDHQAQRAGMTVTLPGPELLTAFCLRWK